MERENENKRIFGDNPVTRLRQGFGGQARMNTFEKLTSLEQPRRRPETSRILTTPQSIVRSYRLEKSRREPPEGPPFIFTPKRPRIPWHQKINWPVVEKMIGFGCGMALGLVGIIILIWFVIPFLRMIRWQ